MQECDAAETDRGFKGHSGPRKRRPKNKSKKKSSRGEGPEEAVSPRQSPPRPPARVVTPVKTTTCSTKLCAAATPFSPSPPASSTSPSRSLEAATRAYWTQWVIEAAENERTRRLQLLAEIQQNEDLERQRRQQWARQAIEAEQHSRTTRVFLDAMQNTAWFQATISPSFLDYEVVCPHSWFGCTYSCMLRHIEDHLLDCPYRQVPDTPTSEDLDLNSYDLVCPNAVLGCKTICSRDTLAAHLAVCGGIVSKEVEWEMRLQSQQSAILASETERLRRINEMLHPSSLSSEVHKLYDAQTKELQARLHAEVAAFGAAHVASATLRRPVIYHVLHIITHVVQAQWPDASVEPYGSFVTHLNLPTSDVDLVIGPFHAPTADASSSSMFQPGDVQRLGQLLAAANAIRTDVVFKSMQVLAHAAIPLLKVVAHVQDEASVALDITFWTPQHQGVASAALGRQLGKDVPGLTEVTLVLKYYLAKRGLNDVYRGGLSSYGLLLMVAHALLLRRESSHAPLPPFSESQESGGGLSLASLQRAKGAAIGSRLTTPSESPSSPSTGAPSSVCLGKLLMNVLHYYGNDFQPEMDAVLVPWPTSPPPPR
ncbi:Aste57867_24408 [Aphanomyces stellatus]|uniref:Aste57867_24408 protein n=1 Tax=Aphanomyces stellatus TaxID=120398 RepID=A0A485LRF8_9STRA|nr:hypothetical protein As57867_024332 [Aphanomyces stellatus]VFU01048.1 Aste57867_24408 [Aphanomyces stellatus]